VDTDHASRLRQAIANENADRPPHFIDPESKYPVIVTTSRLLSTGVDAQTCRLIVLDREVGSMTEFKQIVGRGTRVHEGGGKHSRPRNRDCEGPFLSALAAPSLPSGDEAISRRKVAVGFGGFFGARHTT
jgi:type I site-specific restriction endonuclease